MFQNKTVSKARRVGSSAAVGFLVELLNKLGPILVLALAQSRLGTAAFGKAQFAISLVEMSLPFVIFGYTYQGATEFSKLSKTESNQKAISTLVSSIFTLRIIHAVLASLFLAALFFVIPTWSDKQDSIAYLVPIILISALDMTYINYAAQRMLNLSIWIGGFKLISLVGVYFLVENSEDLWLYSFLTLSVGSLVNIVSFVWVKSKISFVMPSRSQLTSTFQASLLFAGASLFFPLLQRFDIMLVANYLSEQTLGIYTGGWRLAFSLFPFFMVIINIFLSEGLRNQSKEAFEKQTSLAFLICLALGLPISVGSYFVGAQLLSFVFSDEYGMSNPFFTTFCFSLLIESFILIFGFQVLLLKGSLKKLILALFLSLVLGSLIASVFAIKEQALGVAISSLVTKLILASWCFYESRKIVNLNILKDSTLILTASIFMALGLEFTKDYGLIHQLIGGSLIYAFTLAIFYWKKRELFISKLKK